MYKVYIDFHNLSMLFYFKFIFFILAIKKLNTIMKKIVKISLSIHETSSK